MTTPKLALDERLALTVEETAQLLALSRSQAYALVKSGVIPSVRFGGSVRVPRRAIEAMLEQTGSRRRA